MQRFRPRQCVLLLSRHRIHGKGVTHALVSSRSNWNISRSRSPLWSNVVKGLGWGVGLSVGLGAVGTAFFHYGGWKQKVETAHKTLEMVNRVTGATAPADKEPAQPPSVALNLLRDVAKAYVSNMGIPFAGKAIDVAFDSVGSAIDEHGEEAFVIIKRMSAELSAAIDRHSAVPMEAALAVIKIVRRETARLHELVSDPTKREEAGTTVNSAIGALVREGGKLKEFASSPETREKIDSATRVVGEQAGRLKEYATSPEAREKAASVRDAALQGSKDLTAKVTSILPWKKE